MSAPLFLQNVIVVIWDFDETMIPGYMQGPIFKHFGVTEKKFWKEVEGLPAHYSKQQIQISRDTLYLNHILTYVQRGSFKGLNNDLLRQLGGELQFFPGLPEFLPALSREIAQDEGLRAHGIKVEHYVVSTGLRQMILGSGIAKHVDGVWGCEFIEEPAMPGYLPQQHEMALMPGEDVVAAKNRRRRATQPPPRVITQLGYVLDNTTKTRAVFEINKGTNKDSSIDVNSSIMPEDRRVPFQNMIYVADGPSDIPVYSILNQYGGRTFGVYQAGSKKHFAKVYELRRQNRVQAYGEADYRAGSLAHMWITHSAHEIARRIVEGRQLALRERVGVPPGHVVELPEALPAEPGESAGAAERQTA